MIMFIAILVLWVFITALVTYLFCGAAREFVSGPEMELAPVKHDGSLHLQEERVHETKGTIIIF